ncbi:hypothetical protein [Aneurinibacillus tyrosinisolvens]|uniref:hypothetical protein n=1 Tax=Aneurinibacillus tyrosinisolvens TaxID=1443435 RepID=UPI0006996B97|nr:hypothetical protein [Aneurinibacillus tyrosinisolvens]
MKKLVAALLIFLISFIVLPVNAEHTVSKNTLYRKTSKYYLIQTEEKDLYGTGKKQKIQLYALKRYPEFEFSSSWRLIIDGKEVAVLGNNSDQYSLGEVKFVNLLGDKTDEVLFYRHSTGSAGAIGLNVYKPIQLKWIEIFSDPNPAIGKMEERFEVVYVSNFTVLFFDKQTGLKATVPLYKENYAGIKETELTKIGTWIDPISEYNFNDIDGDGIKEITAIQTISGIAHADIIAKLKTQYRYSKKDRKYAAEYIALYDAKNHLISTVKP